MARWGLRWVFCWLSVLITACGQLASPTPAEKTQNHTPLQGFTPPPTASPTEPFRPAYTLTPLGSVTATRAASLEAAEVVTVETPTCYETLAESLICLGWIYNTGNSPITDIIINVYLLSPQGVPLATTRTTPEFPMLFPDSGSPYRVIFQVLPEGEWGVYAELDQNLVVETAPDDHTVPLMVHTIQSEWHVYGYTIRGQIFNQSNQPLSLVRVAAIIWRADRTISGYRMVIFDSMSPDSEAILDFDFEIAPLDGQPGESVMVLAQGSTPN